MNVLQPVTLDAPQTGIPAVLVRQRLLATPAQDVTVGHQTFRGIRLCDPELVDLLTDAFARLLPAYHLCLAFGRSSPAGQVEPNDIHSDIGMGDATALLYLNPAPPRGDGTLFWERVATGQQRGPWTPALEAESHDRSRWATWYAPQAVFGRLLLFPSDFYHSRALVENYGQGDDARLVLVCFLRLAPGASGLETFGDD